MSDAQPRPERAELVVLAVVYVVPLLGTTAVLAWVGLPGLALALLSVEAGVSAAVVRAKRPEGPGPGPVGPAFPVLVAVSVLAGLAAAVLLVGPGTAG